MSPIHNNKPRNSALTADRSPSAKPTYDPLLIFVGGLLALTLYRWVVLAAADLSLYFDEAYYWFWSNALAYGYFSKPPMVAWVIRLMTTACGEGEVCIRSGALLSFPLTAGLVYLLGAKLFDRRVGVWAGLVFATLPVVSFYSRVMTTDSLLLFFWALALYGFVRALRSDHLGDWLLTGLALGGGLLSKYTMGFFLLSVVLYCVWSPDQRKLWRNAKAWTGLALAAAIFAPNLVWNGINGFASFKHTAEIAQWNGDFFHPDKFLEFVGGQFLLFGPVLAVALTILLFRNWRLVVADERMRLPIAFTVPILLIYAVQALVARANLNWAAVAYVPGSLLAAACFLQFEWKRTLVAATVINLLLGVGVYHYVDVAKWLDIPLSRKTDMYTEMKGWRELGAKVNTVLARYPDAGLLCANRRVMSELIYYVQPHPFDAAIYNPSGIISDHFRLTADLGRSQRDSFVFVVEESDAKDFSSRFREVVDLGTVESAVHEDYVLQYRVFLVKHFLGYAS